MKRAGVIFGLLLAPASAAHAQSEAEQRARWESHQVAQRAFEHRLFEEAGFAPIEHLRVSGREVRRLLLHGPYMMFAVPGIEVERLADGRVTLRIQHQGWSSSPVEVDPSSWAALAAGEEAAFARPAFKVQRALPPPSSEPPPICHGWIARLEAGEGRTASWAECGGRKDATYDYVVRLMKLATGSRTDCTFQPNEPFSSFQQCHGPKLELDSPELEAKVSILRKEYDEAPGAERLAAARQALNVPGLTLGSREWLDARAAVARVKEANDIRRDRLRQLRQLAYTATDASAADKAKMRHRIEHWADFVRAQDANYAELLRRLVWAKIDSSP